MNDSDWAVFTQIKELAIEKFCDQAVREYMAIINDDAMPATDRHHAILKLVNIKDDNMQLLFEGHSRGNASYQLMAIRAEGLVDESLLTQLSPAFLAATDPSLYQ